MTVLLVVALSAGCSDKKPAEVPETPKGPTAVRTKIVMAPFPDEGVPAMATGRASTAEAMASAATPAAVVSAPAPLTPVTAVSAAGGTTPGVAPAEGMGISPATAIAEAGSLSPGMRLGGGAGAGMSGDDLEDLAYTYNPAGKVDPFKPFVKETADGTKVGPGSQAEEPPPLPPGSPPPILPDYDWRQLELVAVITTPNGAPVAMVEDPASKKGYTITKGVRLGRTNALVTDISLDSVTVEEMVKDYVTGEWQSRPQTMSVKKTAGD